MSRRVFGSFKRFREAFGSYSSGKAFYGRTAKLAATPATMTLYAALIQNAKAPQPEDAHELKHHVNGGASFINPWLSYNDKSFFQMFYAMASHIISGNANKPDTTPPTVTVHPPKFLPSRETKALRATWLGHACWLVEFPGGLRVLFDPVFEHRCGPMGWIGPGRYTEPPCQIEEIPIVDAVVISHSHYDHLSLPTITRIQKANPNVQFFAPLGNKKWFTREGIHNMTELDWWQASEFKLTKTESKEDSGDPETIEATIGCLPCQHTAARTPFDRATTLWASWSVESGGKKVWFGGDTGYRQVPKVLKGEDDYGEKYKDLPHCPAFAEIGSLRGPFDLGLIPIGAYQPRFIMSGIHANPFDSANIFVDTKCKRGLGMHWGTWVLTEEDVLEPPKLLKEALKKHGIAEEGVFDVCDIGDSREF